MSLAGKYQIQRSEKVKELFLHIAAKFGYEPAEVEAFVASHSELRTTVEIIPDGSKYTLISTYLGVPSQLAFELGQEFDDIFPGKPKSTAALDGDTLVISSTWEGTPIYNRAYKPTADGLIVTIHGELSGVEAEIHFKRL